ncbi:MAG: integrase [Methylocella sp.]
MTVMQTEVFEAFRAIDIPEDKALKAAAALSKRDDDDASLKTDTSILKWMMGFVLAFQAAIFAKLFLH